MQPLPRARRYDGIVLALALAGILAFLSLPPVAPLDKADHAAFAVCHRIATRTFIFGDRPLPLCARCSGTYLGATGALAALCVMGRRRAGLFPARRVWFILGGFVLAWGVDGTNSFLTLFPGVPHLYQPHNGLRLLTGALMGVTLATTLLPALNLALWRAPASISTAGRTRDLVWLAVGAGVLAAPVATEWAPLLYPLALVSGLAILLLLGAVNTMLALVLLRREGQATHPREVVVPALLGVALACGELAASATVRTLLTERFALTL